MSIETNHAATRLIFVYGTSAELIKLYPVILRLRGSLQCELWCTNQQPSDLKSLHSKFALSPDRYFRSPESRPLQSLLQGLVWLASGIIRISYSLLTHRRWNRGVRPIVVVHGDTSTCLMGALAARISRCRLAHVEAGLRSGDWRNPFPEEINRRIVGRLASYSFAPDDDACQNLALTRGVVVNTYGNTAVDSFKAVVKLSDSSSEADPNFVLVSLHRSEFLRNSEVLGKSLDMVIALANRIRVVMVLDSLTSSALSRTGHLASLERSKIDLHPKLAYHDFMDLLIRARFVITDSGGLQEECAMLGIPCLVHRQETERSDGIGTTCLLSRWDFKLCEDFIDFNLVRDRPKISVPDPMHSPSEIISNSIMQFLDAGNR